MDKKLLGGWGEAKAAEFLRRKKYDIVGMNYRCRYGEIDIIASDRKFIVFVEVKLRKSAAFAQAKEFVTRSKQEKVILAAQSWLSVNTTELQPRFDVIEIYAPEGAESRKIEINHIENAFE